MSIKTRLIDYRDGELVCEGMLAWDDEVAGTRPGVLVAHTIRGRSPFEESKARALAERGYAGFAIDVYGKDAIGADIEACRERMETLRSEREVLQQRLLLALQAIWQFPLAVTAVNHLLFPPLLVFLSAIPSVLILVYTRTTK